MTFGAELKAQMLLEWRFYYLDFDELKRLLKQGTEEGKSLGDEERAMFVDMLDKELEKVNLFYAVKLGEIQRRINHCDLRIASSASGVTKKAKAAPLQGTSSWLATFIDIQEEINRITIEVQELARYTRVNYTGFTKIIKKHDKHACSPLKPMFMARLNAKPFFKEANFEGLIIKLSRLHDVVRTTDKMVEEQVDEQMPLPPLTKTGISPAPQPGSRSARPKRVTYRTTKYWIHPDNVMDVKMLILRYLPLIAYDPSRGSDVLPPDSDSLQTTTPLQVDYTVSSVYLDSPALDLYAARLENRPHSSMVRLKWYGNDDKAVHVERNAYGPDLGSMDETCVNDRFTIKEKHVAPWLRGKWTTEKMIDKMRARGLESDEDLDELARLSEETQKMVLENQLEPVLGTVFNRTAFQLPGDGAVRISLDTQSVMWAERSGDGGQWRRSDIGTGGRENPYSDSDLDSAEEEGVYRFPFAVMKVRIRQHPEQREAELVEPRWVTELVSSPLVEPVSHFSEYNHGVAMLFGQNVPLLPFWLPQMEKDLRKNGSSYRTILRDTKARSSISNGSSGSTIRIDSDEGAGPEGSRSSPQAIVIDADYGQKSDRPKKCPKTTERTPLLREDNDERIERIAYFSFGRRKARDEEAGHTESWTDGIPRPSSFLAASTSFLGDLVGWKAPASTTGLPSWKPAEPKAYFANERTFITWLSFCTLLGGFSLGLYNFGDDIGRMVGMLFAGLTVFITCYTLVQYQRRVRMIMGDLGPYDDRAGPAIVCVCLIFIVGLNFYLRLAHVESQPSTGGGSR